MPYLKSGVIDLELPDFINHLIPIVEAQFQTPVAKNFCMPFTTTETINPGVIWVGNYFQVGLEAIIPINRQSDGYRRGRAAASLSRRHVPNEDRAAAHRATSSSAATLILREDLAHAQDHRVNITAAVLTRNQPRCQTV
jgi:hypothetical protein